ncbi:AEC family transporter [Desulfospira joergensenii]|uniref:AEC family transporter n=1 Tax=Desulfospira joergensenii TaxID=53329 RepID=UPI0003B73FD3|nr:AEC family transporter [Desulfospira joergensenii]
MLILNTIFPLFALLILGSLLKGWGLTSEAFLKTSDRLVYYIFFPAMLFWKLGSGSGGEEASPGLCAAGVLGVGLVFLLSLRTLKSFKIPSFKAGSFVQAGIRFNTYIGMAIVLNTLGEAGVRHFGILVGIVIPMINVMVVSVLIWHSSQDLTPSKKTLFFIRALVSNPLIIACVLGLLYSRTDLGFPVFMDNTFSLMTAVTLPLALISIGGTLRFKGLAEHARLSFTAAVLKLVILPLTGFILLKIFHVTGIPFKTGMIFFCLPTSTAIYVLSAQLNSDTDLASAAIMLSTLLSFVSLSVALMLG